MARKSKKAAGKAKRPAAKAKSKVKAKAKSKKPARAKPAKTKKAPRKATKSPFARKSPKRKKPVVKPVPPDDRDGGGDGVDLTGIDFDDQIGGHGPLLVHCQASDGVVHDFSVTPPAWAAPPGTWWNVTRVWVGDHPHLLAEQDSDPGHAFKSVSVIHHLPTPQDPQGWWEMTGQQAKFV